MSLCSEPFFLGIRDHRKLSFLINHVLFSDLASDFSSDVHSALGGFVDQYVSVYQARVFRVLETVAALCPDLYPDSLLPLCTHAVKMSEAKRGVGVDKPLRYVK